MTDLEQQARTPTNHDMLLDLLNNIIVEVENTGECILRDKDFGDLVDIRSLAFRAAQPGEGEDTLTQSDVDEAKDAGATYVLSSLAEKLGVDWGIRDGSETWEGDVWATMAGILEDAGVWDPDTDAIAKLGTRPGRKAAGVCICEVAFGQNEDCPTHGIGTAWRQENPEADMRAAPSALATPQRRPEREAVARIIDPNSWVTRDQFQAIIDGTAKVPDDPDQAAMHVRSAKRRVDTVVASSLAKADAILALLPSEQIAESANCSGAPVEMEDRVEALAQFLHDEGGFGDAFSDRTWPEHPGDTGQREGGWVKIVPSDAQAKFRDVARRALLSLSLLPSEDGWREEAQTAALHEIAKLAGQEHGMLSTARISLDAIASMATATIAAVALSEPHEQGEET